MGVLVDGWWSGYGPLTWAPRSGIVVISAKDLYMFPAYTDYPIHNIYDDINDTDDFLAPIRKITILTYDRNKYCDVLVFFTDSDGDERATVTSIKAGYCYKNEARYDEGIPFSYDELITLPWKY